MKDIEQSSLSELGAIVAMEAWDIFNACGVPSDFCIQNITATGAVFGGWNRLLWNMKDGFRPDFSYCTSAFMDAFDTNFPS